MERCRFCNCMRLRDFCENIFDNKQTNPTIPTIVEMFTNLKIVKNDPYTKFVCFNCFNILIVFYHYREKVLETNELLLKNKINTNQNNVEDFYEKWPRIKQCDDGQFVVYNNDSDDDCKANLRIGSDSEDEDNQPLSTLIGDNKPNNDELRSTIVTTFDENQGDHKNNRILNKPLDDIKKETTSNNNNNNNNSDKDSVDINEQQMCKKLYQCDICGKNFVTNAVLKKHLLLHTGERPYHCNICGKNFATNGVFKIHSLIHKGEKPHQCYICGKRFTQIHGLKRHLLIHTDEKTHECNICYKKFKDTENLKKHLKIHSFDKPHQCTICNMRFSQKMYLKKHLLIHSDEKAHQCNICEKKFTYKKGLTRHLKIHTGEKPYECDICNKRFIQRGNLKIHSKVHKDGKSLSMQHT